CSGRDSAGSGRRLRARLSGPLRRRDRGRVTRGCVGGAAGSYASAVRPARERLLVPPVVGGEETLARRSTARQAGLRLRADLAARGARALARPRSRHVARPPVLRALGGPGSRRGLEAGL